MIHDPTSAPYEIVEWYLGCIWESLSTTYLSLSSHISTLDKNYRCLEDHENNLWVGFSYLAWVPIIGTFIKSQCVPGNDYLKEGYLVPQKRVRSESYPECEQSGDVRLL